MTWLTGEWSPLIRIGDAIEQKWWEKLPSNHPGVYRLVALRDNSLDPEPLCRVCGTDEEGTLYIGASQQSLAWRLGALVKTHRPDYKSQPHRVLSKQLATKFTANRLGISWELAEKPWRRESKLLVVYEDTFGELPPSNRSAG